MSEKEIIKALDALAKADEGMEVSPQLELRLRTAFRKKYRRRVWPYTAFVLAAAAALVVFLALKPKPQNVPSHAAIITAPAPVVQPRAEAPVVDPQPVRAAVHRARRPAQPQEIMTDFFPLMAAPPPFDRGEIVRVALPAAAMRTVGLPVDETRLADRVQADVLVGEEGLARAIRFVRFVQ